MSIDTRHDEDINPFDAQQPHCFVTQDVHECDICERSGGGVWYTIMLSYAGQWLVSHHTCPDCMRRLGFQPKVCIPIAEYDALREDAALMSNMRSRQRTASKSEEE